MCGTLYELLMSAPWPAAEAVWLPWAAWPPMLAADAPQRSARSCLLVCRPTIQVRHITAEQRYGSESATSNRRGGKEGGREGGREGHRSGRRGGQWLTGHMSSSVGARFMRAPMPSSQARAQARRRAGPPPPAPPRLRTPRSCPAGQGYAGTQLRSAQHAR
jgi:hypothetical protein